MTAEAARMRRWMIRGAPVIALAAPGGHAGGGMAAMLLWLLLGALLLPAPRYPYPRRRTLQPARLFFAFCGGALALALLYAGAGLGFRCFFPETALSRSVLLLGAILPAVCLCGWLLTLRLSARRAWAAGSGMLLVLALLYRR